MTQRLTAPSRPGGSKLLLTMVAAAAIAGSVVAAAPANAAVAAPWAESNYNAAGSRANPVESTLTPTTVASLRRVASTTISATDPDHCDARAQITAPIESAGYVYALANGRVLKTNARTGAVVWRHVLDSDYTTSLRSLALANGFVVVAGVDCVSQSDPKGVLYALSARSGGQAWTNTLPGALSQMVISGRYVVSIGASLGSGIVVAANDVTTGASRWSDFYDSACPVDGTRLVVAGGTVIFGACTDAGAAFLAGATLATGVQRWTRNGPWTVGAGDTDASAGRDVYVTNSHGYLTDIVPQTGVIRGTFPIQAKVVLAVGSSRLYTTCSSGVCAYSRATRALVWSSKHALTSPLAALAGTVLYLADGTALRADTGARCATLWSGTASSMIVGDGHLEAVLSPRTLSSYGLGA